MVVNPGFDDQARKVARAEGIPAIQVAVYPDPFDLETDAQLREKSVRLLLPQIIDALTKPVAPAPKQSAAEKDNRAIVFTGTIDQINRYVTEKGWSDGLSITPPTRERVEEFLKYTGYAPDEEITILPLANLRATPWNIAVNGVMAGCRPEYMPILIAAVQAMGDPAYHYNLFGGSTHSFTSFFWVNGPIARQLGIDHGQGLIANPVNAVLGRAMSLIERNIAGLRIKETQMGSFGKQPMYFLAEDEEAMGELGQGWEPYHVARGFARNANTVSASYSTVWGRNLIPATSDPKILMQLMAYGITTTEAFASGLTGMPRCVLIGPGVAKVLAQGGYTKETLRRDLVETGRKITYEAIFSKVYGSVGNVHGTFDQELAKVQRNPANEKGKLPPWYPRFPGWEQIQTMPAVNQVEILVCGDPARNKVQTLASGRGRVTIKEIKLPSRWHQLMEQLGRPPLEEFYLKTSVTSAAKTDEKPKASAAKTNEKPGVAANEANQSAAAKTSVKSSEEPKSLDGEWTWTQGSTAGGRNVERRVKLTIKNGKVEGTVFGGQFGQSKVPDAAIVSGEFKNGRITFVTGNERTTKYEGVVEGDSIKGTIDGRGRDGKPMRREWNATRAAETVKKN